MQCYVNVSSHWPIRTGFLERNRELIKQSSYGTIGTATTVNQQLNYRVKRNPQTADSRDNAKTLRNQYAVLLGQTWLIHVSCRNLTRVLNMSNNFKELLKSSTSPLVVYPMLVAFAEAVGDVKL